MSDLRELLADQFRSASRSPHHLAFLVEPVVRELLAGAWEEGKCAASRGVRVNPYIDTASKNEEA